MQSHCRQNLAIRYGSTDFVSTLYVYDEEIMSLFLSMQRRLLDPKHTNFLTDIRSPDIKPNVLDEIGFLSNDSDEDVLPPAAPAFQTRSKVCLTFNL